MKGKFRIFAITFAMVMALLGGMLIAQPAHKAYAADLDTRIDFTPVVSYTGGNYTQTKNNDTFLLGGETISNTTVTVAYNIVYSDDVNNLLLIPTYDDEIFSVVSITPNNEVLGNATITEGDLSSGTLKILFDSATTFSLPVNSDPVTLFTIEFALDTSAALQDNAVEYSFGLFVPEEDTEDYNDMSTAHVDLTDVHKGEQERVAIRVINEEQENIVKVLRMLDAHIAIGHNSSENENNEKFYSFVYGASAPAVEEVEELNTIDPTTVEYTYDGTAETLNIKWYGGMEYDSQLEQYVYVDELQNAPVNVGKYYVGISAPADGVYKAVPATYREVNIIPVQILVNIANKSSDYGDSIVALTHDYSGSVDLGISLSTTATSSSNVGNYPITGSWSNNNPNYSVQFSGGTYTITPKAITITALDQSAVYTGSEPTVDQTKYTVSGATITEGVTITKEAGVNVGEYTLTPSLNNNYTVTPVTGKFYITSVNYNESFFTPYFSGDIVTYDAVSHDLLIVQNLPNWFSYTASNNVQTNANEYLINVKVTLTEQNAANYTNGVNEFNFTVPAEIEKLALTVTAENKTSEYGTTPATLTPTKTGLNNEVDVTFTVENNGTPITLSSTTDVGTYDIVPNATSTNYTFTFINGTYTVTKTNPVITVTANNVYYNRALDYTVTVTVAGQEINAYTVAVNNVDLPLAVVLNAGEHIITVNVPAGANYNAGSKSAGFTVNKIALATPTFTYDHDKATWEAVVADNGGVALVEGTGVTYTINGNATTNCTYTANSTDELKMVISPINNDNYLPVDEVVLKEVYKVEFTSIEGNFGAATNMPTAQYQFKGQTAVQPDSNPAMTGYTFVGWNYTFSTLINSNTQIPAIWNIVQYTMTVVYVHSANNTYVETSKTFKVNYNSNVVINTSNFTEKANITDIISQYNLNGMRYTFNGFWNYKITGEDEYIRENVTDIVVNATQNYTFVALYNATPIVYNITYMISVDGSDYTAMQDATNVKAAFGSVIELDTLNNIVWFNEDAWYTDTDRTQLVPETMPAHDLVVYGSYVFDIGTGDINADGSVDANDIMLYRQWIVGGYTMTVVAKGSEFDTAKTYNSNTRYFLTKVADNNLDHSEDIRDVSITRMAMVGGYYWDIDSGKNVTGQEIIRNVRATEASAIAEALEGGKKVTLTGNVSAETAISVTSSKDIYLDLGGSTLTVASFSVVSNSRSTITIKNGTIVTTEGITISAPYGNVMLENLTGYDSNGLVNLAAANHSLHLDGAVEFYKGTIAEPTPASINVEKGTHIVVEENAVLEVASIVVTNNFVNASEDTSAKISISSFSSSVTVANVETKVSGHVEKKENGIYSLADLQNAALVGGSYVLEANIETTSTITFNEDITIEGNEHIFKVKVAGSAEVTILNAHIMNLTVVANNGFTGTLVFDGGILNTDSDKTGDADAAFYSQNNPNATFEFRNMTIGANITKGIKIFNAKAVVIDNCEFDATKLRVVQNAINSNIQSLSLVDIQLQNEGANITITDSKFIGAPQGSIAVPESVYGFGTMADSDTGAAIKLKVEKGVHFGTVTITGNTFASNYRDIVVGTGAYVNRLDWSATAEGNGRSGDGLQYNTISGWIISGNTTDLEDVVEERGVATLSFIGGPANFNKYTTRVGNVGEIVGGVAIWNIGKVLEKIDGTWYYVEDDTVYAVSVAAGKAVLTPVVVSTEQELLNAMQNENCHFVVLNEDIDVSSQILVTRDVKLDLNGKKVTYVGETELKSGIFGVKRGGLLTINDTVGNGKIDASVNAYAAVILTVSGESATGEKAKVVVNGGTLEGYYYGITGNGIRHDTELVVNGGTLYGINGSGIYNPQDGSVLVNNGSIKGFGSAIEIRAGQLEINGGVFEALTNNWVATGNGSGTTIEGAIIAISQHTTNKNITVTINDGTFTNGIRSLVMYDTVNTGRSERMNVTINGGSFNSVSNKDTVTIMARNGNLVINGGNFNSGADNNGEGCSTVYAITHGQVTINGGTFKAGAKYENRYWTLNIYNGSTGTASMTVRGGEFEDFNPSNPNTDDNVTYVENGYVVSSQIVDEKTIYTVSAE